MDIEKGIAPTGNQYISFVAKYNEKYTLVACGKTLRCALRAENNHDFHAPYTHFEQEQVKAVLPFLQAFAETGTFGTPAEEEIEEDEDEEQTIMQELAAMQEAVIAMAANIVDQGQRIEALVKTTATLNYQCYEQEKRVKALEALVQEWATIGTSDFYTKVYEELQEKTAKLLGIDDASSDTP